MKLFPKAVSFSHELIDRFGVPGSVAVDATCGNGHDAIYLAERLGPQGKVIAFDVQSEAIENTRCRFAEKGLLERLVLIHDTHARLAYHLNEHGLAPQIIVFNLGYLPGCDKKCITQSETTIEAVKQSLEVLLPSGILIMTVYPGHEGGREEAEAVEALFTHLSQETFNAIRYSPVNQRNNPPYVFACLKRKD